MVGGGGLGAGGGLEVAQEGEEGGVFELEDGGL